MARHTFSILHQCTCASRDQHKWDLLRQIFKDDEWKPQCFRYLTDRDRYGRTPLHLFCTPYHLYFSEEDEMEFINNRKAQNTLRGIELLQPVRSFGNDSRPLDVAYHLLHPDCIFLQDDSGRCPLHCLFYMGCNDPPLIQLILGYAESLKDGYGAYYLISHQSKYGHNTLHHVCYGTIPMVSMNLMLEYCHESVLKLLGSKAFEYSHPALSQDMDGNTPLHVACYCGSSFYMLETLLNEAPACALLKNKQEWLPIDCLMSHYEHRHHHAVRFLKETGQWMLTQKIDDMKLRRVSEYSWDIEGWWKCISLLLRAATLGTIAPTETPWRPLHAACQFTAFTTVAFDLACLFCPNEVSVPDEQGRLPLHIAVASVDKNSSKKMQMLTQMCPGAALVKTWTGRLPIALAVESGKEFQDIQVMLEAAPQTIATMDEWTQLYPFMLAAVEGNNSLDTVFHLILSDPSLVQSGIP